MLHRTPPSIIPCMQAGDDKKLLQAASRKKKLEERFGLEKSAKGTRFKVSCSLALGIWR